MTKARALLVTDAVSFDDPVVLVRPKPAVWPTGQVVSTDVTDGGIPGYDSAATVVVTLPRSKRFAKALIEEAARKATGIVVVDGQKTDGIDALWRDCRKRVEMLGSVTKAHGRAFWFAPTDAFADWADPDPVAVDGVYTRPGVFAEGRLDKATELLINALPEVSGTWADLGAGAGALARALFQKGAEEVHLIEAEQRALDCARLTTDGRGQFHWADATQWRGATGLSGVVMNPPFHEGRSGVPELGQAFIRTAAAVLSPRGSLYMVANRHLPYEAVLAERFAQVKELEGSSAFKIFQASRPKR